MRKLQGQLIYSPTDLTMFLASPFALWMERYALEVGDSQFQIDESDSILDALAKKGKGLEEELLSYFQSQGKSILIVEGGSDKQRQEITLQGLRDGIDVIYQACLQRLPFSGYADFLVKVAGKSRLGDYHYEVWDSKLSKQAKSSFIIQLCCYAEMLFDIQGRDAENIVIALGSGENVRLPIREFRYYYQHVKELFLVEQNNFDSALVPDPGASREWGRWSTAAQQILESQDHLSLVATITRNQIKNLQHAGINTATELAETTQTHVSKINNAVLTRLIAQAKIQKRSKGLEVPAFEIIRPNEGEAIGLALLPPHSPNDIFFDIEGYPLVEGGLEYLWGSSYFDETGQRQFKDFWAHNAEQEKQAFSQFIQWVYARWLKDPTMHIYHYANYEIAACRRLMGKYGVCEHEVDELLRNEVFVDLYKIVRHGLLLGEPRYSIKNVEHLYRGKRETEVGTGGDSVIVYEAWRDHPDGDSYQNSKILNDIREYNIDDCDSTQELTEWLRRQQALNNIEYIAYHEPEQKELSDEIDQRLQLRERLLQRAEEERQTDIESANVTELLAWLLEFHRRQDKPSWWRLFDRLGMTDLELYDDLDCIAQCQRTDSEAEKPTPRARQLAYEYSFNANQEFKTPKSGTDMWILGVDELKVKLVSIDTEAGLICVQAKEEPPARISLIPFDIIRAQPIPEAIESVVCQYADGDLKNNAILDFLFRRFPRIHGHEGGSIINEQSGTSLLEQVIQSILNLDNSYLCIQGPPGAGKTFTGKHVIAELVKRGKKIGISSNSHKAINNLLLGVATHCQQLGIEAHCCCTKDTGNELSEAGIQVIKNAQLAVNVQPGCVLGTTAWGFARNDMAEQLDYLFVDEAGQVAVANLVAMSRSANNLVLKGDQMQLGQPVQGSHPGASGQSVLEYLLQEHATIPKELGVFLGTTYRMHPDVNQFISEMIYEGRLHTAQDNINQIVEVPSDYEGVLNKEAGIIFIPVEHEGNAQASEEEAQVLVDLSSKLLGRTAVDRNSNKFTLDWQHMLFMAPYNHQVNLLHQRLGSQAKVGSVDKFQGQEAPVVFISLCASNANEAPRGLSFLLNKNRLNVAISRALSLAIIVATPNLVNDFQGSVEDMKLANLFSRIVQEYSLILK